jgi:hypothetical protein
MARWSRSGLRNFGVAAVALLGGSLLVIPAVSDAADTPAPSGPVAAAPRDRIAVFAGRRGHSTFEFQAASGDRQAPFAFVSTNGQVSARQLGSSLAPVVKRPTGGPTGTVAAAPTHAVVPAAPTGPFTTTMTIDSAKWSATIKTITLWNADSWTTVPVTSPQNSLSATAALTPGHYFVAVMYGDYQVDSYLLTKAFTVTDKAQTIHLAESSAKEVAITVDDSTARTDMSAVWLALPNGDLVGFAGGPQTRTYVTTASVPGTTLRVHEVLTKAGSSAAVPTPYRYDLVKSWPYPLPTSPILAVKTASLAKTITTIRAQGINADGLYETVPSFGEWTGVYVPTNLRFPATVTEYVTPGVTFLRLAGYGPSAQLLNLTDRSLPAGTSAGETVGAGPLAPARSISGSASHRSANKMQISEYMTLGDAAGNPGNDSTGTVSMTLSSGGQVLKTAAAPGMSVDVPAAAQTYLLEQTLQRTPGWSELSTKVDSEWMFQSAGPYNGTLALMDLGLAVTGLDQRNRAGSAPTVLTVKPTTRYSAAPSTVEEVEASFDDGATWTGVPLTAVTGGSQVSLTVPATAAFVSLRISAANNQGGALRRTIMRALAGPATPADEAVGSTTITNLKVNGGASVVPGTSGSTELLATFTATDPSGIASGGLVLWHGSYNTPDGVQTATTTCGAVNATTANCTADVYIWDVRWSLGSNALAGAWHAEAWARAKDGVSFTDRHAAGSVAIKQPTKLTADATPEPVKKGKTITVAGALTRLDWTTWAYKAYPSQTVSLQWAKVNTSTWTTVKSVKADSTGKLKTTVTAGSDGSYRYVFAGDAATNTSTSAADYIDVQ